MTATYGHGLIIGKFYPPHLGHHAVIRAAAQQCERLTVVAMASVAETIPLAARVAWLRAEHATDPNVHVVGIGCDAPVDLDDPSVWAAQVAAMRAAIRTSTRQPVDVVFSAERYGEELAARFDAKHVLLERQVGSPSGRAARRDLAAAWRTLAPATRAGLATRVVVLGAESTGTTTLSQQLVEHYRARSGVWSSTRWVGEFGRDYTQIKWAAERDAALLGGRREPGLDEIGWTPADFDRIAAEQTHRESVAALSGSPLLICDTDAFATGIWARRYLGNDARPRAWMRAPLLPRRDLYLITDHEGVGWQDDGLREGDLAVRAAMTGWFIDALTAAGHSWVLLTGTATQRLDLAVRTLDPLLAHRARFAAPLRGPGFEPSP